MGKKCISRSKSKFNFSKRKRKIILGRYEKYFYVDLLRNLYWNNVSNTNAEKKTIILIEFQNSSEYRIILFVPKNKKNYNVACFRLLFFCSFQSQKLLALNAQLNSLCVYYTHHKYIMVVFLYTNIKRITYAA